MKTKAVICLLDETQRGISKSTGTPWESKEMVLEITGEDGHRDTLAVKTMNHEVIQVLEQCVTGDAVTVHLGFNSRARTFVRKDGSEGVIRQTEIYVRNITKS